VARKRQHRGAAASAWRLHFGGRRMIDIRATAARTGRATIILSDTTADLSGGALRALLDLVIERRDGELTSKKQAG